jgi:hypothetical protein
MRAFQKQQKGEKARLLQLLRQAHYLDRQSETPVAEEHQRVSGLLDDHLFFHDQLLLLSSRAFPYKKEKVKFLFSRAKLMLNDDDAGDHRGHRGLCYASVALTFCCCFLPDCEIDSFFDSTIVLALRLNGLCCCDGDDGGDSTAIFCDESESETICVVFCENEIARICVADCCDAVSPSFPLLRCRTFR